MPNVDQHFITVAEKAANYTTAGGAGSAFAFGLTANEFAAVGGLVIGALGLVASIFFKWLNHRLLREEVRSARKAKKIISEGLDD
jgi:ABC-type proline/glycine betaine transport system permease subunit